VSGSPFTAATFNQQVRDNLLATAAANASWVSSWFPASGPNTIVERYPAQASDPGSSTTTSTSYVNLADGLNTAVTVGTSTAALVLIYCNMSISASGTGLNGWMSYAVSGATTSAASDDRAMLRTLTGGERFGISIYHTGLTPGSNTFTLKYRVTGAITATYSVRRIAVIPF
jgi:hypothetical protein